MQRLREPHRDIINYVKTPDAVKLAYTVSGNGPTLLYLPPFPRSHLELEPLNPARRVFYDRLASHHRLVRMDYRGVGLSNADEVDLTMDNLVSDLEAVLQECGAGEFSVLASGTATPLAIALAARSPQLRHLVLWDAIVPSSTPNPAVRALSSILDDWETFLQARYRITLSDDEAREAAELVRESMTPDYFRKSKDLWAGLEMSDLFDNVSAPTLVIHPRQREQTRAACAFVAAAIPGARMAVVEGSAGEIFNSDLDVTLRSVEEFLCVVDPAEPTWALAPADRDTDAVPAFTRREIEIVQLLAAGMRSKEIARELCLSTHTVERHIANLYRKTGVNGRVALTIFALKHGLISESEGNLESRIEGY